MHDLFGRRYYNPSSSYNHHHPSYKPTTTTTTTTTRYREIPVERNFSSPKVVSIPVHYVGKEINRSTAALRIQTVFRGFLVRKRVKAILGIKKQVDGIEKNFYEKELVDLLKKDGKERLKLNEMLMGLLFKLDSIRGIDSGVRELRKSVIKKAIMLQERLDSIVFEQEETLDQEEQNWEFVESDDDEAVEETNLGEELGQGDSNLDREVEMQEALDTKTVEEGNLNEYCGKKDATMEIECKQEEKTDDGMKELMEKLMEKNEMLVGMVADLCEKNKLQAQVNQMQARVLTSLIKRVDNLERSFKNERSKCKKQRKQVAGSQDAYKKP